MAYTKPTTALLFNFNGINVGVWAFNSPVGWTVYAFEQKADGQWYGLDNVGLFYGPDFDDATFVGNITSTGGPVAFCKSLLAKINAAFSTRFATPTTVVGYVPPALSGNGTQASDVVNATLLNLFEFYVDANGKPQVRAKAGV